MRPSQLSIIISLVVLVLAGPQPASGGVNRWSKHGPEGGSVISMAVDSLNEMVVYAGTDAGVYKTGRYMALRWTQQRTDHNHRRRPRFVDGPLRRDSRRGRVSK
jgi:hypothetical protein